LSLTRGGRAAKGPKRQSRVTSAHCLNARTMSFDIGGSLAMMD
jgi:hypothetical protein